MTKQAKKPVKLTAKQAHAEHQLRHRVTLGAGIVVIAVLLGLVLTLLVVPRVVNDTRLGRVNTIFASIELPPLVYNETDTIFGDKRPYNNGTGTPQTVASSKTFVVGQSVTDTFNQIDAKIRAAGYSVVSDANPASVTKLRTYKTSKNEYIFLDVESKLRLDAFQNALWMGDASTNTFKNIDPNAGPSKVTLSVNLDDKNY